MLSRERTTSGALSLGAVALAVAAAALVLGAAALPDGDQPIHIEADEGTFDPNGESVLTGAVTLRQGALHLSAHRMTVSAREQRIERIVAAGQGEELATLRQEGQAGEGVVYARAKRIDYAVAEQRIRLTGNAFVEQADQEISADTVDWNIAAGRVAARSDEPGGVKLVWQPEAADAEDGD